jgi:hypothetical protein
MWVTEEEAATTICPVMSPSPIPGYKCCASECRWWVWRSEDTSDKLGNCARAVNRSNEDLPARWSR